MDALQGEIGASTVKCRDMKNKLKMVKFEEYRKWTAEGCGGEECRMDKATGGVCAYSWNWLCRTDKNEERKR